ncbi:MAG: alpha-galactosidase, partial [Clostridia bacterium]|nr:alpha-galactosidase [Clostridia bacterium]
MAIQYSEEFKSFYLSTPNTSYVFHVNDGGFLIHDYYGKSIPVCDMRDYAGRFDRRPLSADLTTYPNTAPMEYSCNGTGDYRVSALQIRSAAGDAATDVRYVSHKIYGGKPSIQGQPSTYGTEQEVTTLEILTQDAVTGAQVTLYYSVFETVDAIARRVTVTNTSEIEMDLERIYSLCCELPFGNWEI